MSQEKVAFREFNHEMAVQRYEAVPEVKACMALPVEGLKDLPRGVEVERSNGRARASVRVERDTVYFYAHCDSLQRLVEVYRGMVEHREVARKRDFEWWWLVIVGLVIWRLR